MSKIRNKVQRLSTHYKKDTELSNMDIASVRTRKDLLEIIEQRFSRLISFDDLCISLIDHTKKFHTNFIYYSAVGRERKENFFKITNLEFRLDDEFYNVIMESSDPIVWDLVEINHWKTIPEYLEYFIRNGVKKILAMPLSSLNDNLGCLFFFSEDQEAFTAEELQLAGDISNQLSSALLNILFVEEIEKRDREKEILLDLITVIASIRDRVDLEKVLEEHLKKVVSFADLAIPMLNADKLTHRIYIKHFDKERKIAKEYAQKLTMGRCSSRDGILEVILNSHYPTVWVLEDVLTWDIAPIYVRFWSENQMKKMVGVPIKSKGEALGAVLFFSESLEAFQPEDLTKINAIANQLSVAVLNILASEEMQKREHEKEILLSLSNDIAAIRNKQELLVIVKQRLKALLPFNDLVITSVSSERQFHQCFIYDYENKRSGHKDFDRLIKSFYPVEDGVINITMRADYPIVFEVKELLKNDAVPEYVHYYKHTGIKEIVGVAMRNGNEEVGGLFLTSEQAGAFSSQHLSLLKSISSQLGIVISNIVANEIIIEKERDTAILLTFSNEISVVRDRRRLRNTLTNTIRKLIPFAQLAIIVYDYQHHRHVNFLSAEENGFPRPVLAEGDTTSLALTDELLRQTGKGVGPVVFSINELADAQLLKRQQRNGLDKFIGIPMHNGGQVLGGLYLFSEPESDFQVTDYGLLQGIADQLTFTVINILANESIIKRENEKTILLEMSKDMAKVRNKTDLHRIVSEKLKRLLKYNYSTTVRLDEGELSASVFLGSQDGKIAGNKELSEIMNRPFPVSDGILNVATSAERPVVFDLEEMNGLPDIPRYVTLNYELGLKEMVVTPFFDSKRHTGFLIIFSTERNFIDENHLSLIQGLASQLSIAMSNIIANEKIERQIAEISSFKQQLQEENFYLQEEIHTTYNYSEIIGASEAMNEIFHLISQVSETQSSVLILGETGTGKELIARAIHNTSLRKNKLMVKVNCATLPANLIESELFGHERGSFTGATDRRIGKFELANNSTLFLDEIGELPLDLQVKLLRALQEQEIERLGGRSVIKINVRVIAATNRNLAKEIQLSTFRSDLFFRLNVFPITIPALRERKDDIPILAAHFLEKHAKKLNKRVNAFSGSAIAELMAYDWPGNVRELEHLIERTILLTSQSTIGHIHLPLKEGTEFEGQFNARFKTIDEIEREHIITVLRACRGKVGGEGGAAEVLRIPTTTLHSKMKRLGIGKRFDSK